jgi:tripartite ATP-independent transporter DctM subunit
MIDAGYLAPFMFLSLFLLLLSGYPVAFVLGAVGLIFGLIGVWLDVIPPILIQAVPDRLFGIMKNDTLLAIPFFTLMGLILERSGMAEQLLEALGRLLARVRGGLAFAVIAVGALLAATTGVVAASVMAMGLISLPVMLRQGYSPALSSGVIMASGTLAQILPPSLVLIVLADTLGAPVGDMYIGAMLPSAILIGLFALFMMTVAWVKPELLPRTSNPPPIDWSALLWSLLPPLILIFLVLGTIFIGLATPTEAGAMGATGALVLALLRRKLNKAALQQALEQTARLTCFVLFILIGSSLFSLVFRALGGDLWVEHLFGQLPGGVMGFIVVVNTLIFILGMFLDFFEIVFIVVPLLVPVLHQFGLSPIWFGIIVAMNLQSSFLTPPFGFSLFYLKSVAPPSLKSRDLYRGAVPFILIQLFCVVLIVCFPQLILKSGPEAADPLDQQNMVSAPKGTTQREAIDLMMQIAAEYPSPPSSAQGSTP